MKRHTPKVAARTPPKSVEAFVAGGISQHQSTSVGATPRKATATGRVRLQIWLPVDVADRFTAQCDEEKRTLAAGVELLIRASLDGSKKRAR